jgi:hypothetical protein
MTDVTAMHSRSAEAMKIACFSLVAVVALGAQSAASGSLRGAVAFDGCSGALISLAATPDVKPDPGARGVVMTNGHCHGLQAPGSFEVDTPQSFSVGIYDSDDRRVSHAVSRLIYATMTGTDVALYELDATYGQLAEEGIVPYTLAPRMENAGAPIRMVSGRFETVELCAIDSIVHRLDEAEWHFPSSYSYAGCNSRHGTSGAPLISQATGEIIGINNTHQDSGERCTVDNPCEVDEDGTIRVVKGMSYGQRTDVLLGCVNAQGAFDLDAPTCALPGGALAAREAARGRGER